MDIHNNFNSLILFKDEIRYRPFSALPPGTTPSFPVRGLTFFPVPLISMIWRISKTIKNIFLKRERQRSGKADWVMAEIPRTNRILIYKHCVAEFRQIIKSNFPLAKFYGDGEKSLYDAIKEAEAIVGWRFPEELLRNAVKLRWIQLISSGISVSSSGYGLPSCVKDNVIITGTKGLHSDTVADYVLWAILTMSRKLNLVMNAQIRKTWAQHIGDDPKGKTVGILGVGNIGASVAHRVKNIGMKAIAVRKHHDSAKEIQDIDKIYHPDMLNEFLGLIDFMVVCLPLTVETAGMIGRKEFEAMKKGAILINVSRGEVVREDDLVWAIKNRIIRGAVLDVFEKEPLTEESELWTLKNVVITPHISGIASDYADKVGKLFCENLKRFVSNQDLLNVLDVSRGY